ncbi:MAG TPA: hypothetical protein VEJ37_09550 [Xanthobacteraceae bacterium]|nr:hypothetical protein [Xanthobacteraceae bacterium]
MLRIGIVTASAFVSINLFVSASATAQTAAGSASGNPLQLMRVAEQPQQTKKSHARSLAKSSTKSRLTARNRTKTHGTVANAADQGAPAPASEQTSTATIWPVVNTLSPTALAATAPPAWPAPDQAATEMVVGGQTVHVVSADDVNELDLAAKAETAMPSDAALPAGAPATTSLARETDELGPKADLLKAADVEQSGAPVGSASWILQVLAALGGAATAASLAWFMIGATPQRTYG